MTRVHTPMSPERVREFMESGVPFNAYLGVKIETLEAGLCVLRLPWRPELIGDPFRPSVHGGVTAMLVDTAGGTACFTRLSRDTDRLGTVDMRVDYLRPGAGEDLYAEGTVVRMGNRVGVASVRIFCGRPGPDTLPIATGSAVYSVFRPGDRA